MSTKEAMSPGDKHSGIESELNNRVLGWVIAAVVACVAGLGLVAFAVLAVVAVHLIANSQNQDFELPGWVLQVGGIALVVATAAFAWLVATAVERSRNSNKEARGTHGGDG